MSCHANTIPNQNYGFSPRCRTDFCSTPPPSGCSVVSPCDGGRVCGCHLQRNPLYRFGLRSLVLRRLAVVLLLVLVAPMFGAGEARADVLATNLGTLLTSQRGDFFHAVEVSDYNWESAPVGIAQKFTTGDHGGGYTLSSVDVCVLEVTALAVPKVTIYTADADGNPGALKYTLSNPASYNEAGYDNTFTSCDDGENAFTAPSNATLESETDYFVVFENVGTQAAVETLPYNPNSTYLIGKVASGAEGSGASGWSIADAEHYKENPTDNWAERTGSSTRPVRLQINGSTITVQPQSTLALTVDAIATDDTVNIAEKTAGFTITGATGTESGVSVSVTIGSQSPLIATSGSNGAWSVSVPPAASYITGTSVAVSVSASKTGFTAPNNVTRTVTVDLAAPSVSYTTPSGLQVEVAITAMSPTTSDTDIASYSATGLPSGLVIDAMTGAISGTPNSANASTQQATVTVSDSADNTATTSITFPTVAKGEQTLTGFQYGASTVTFGSPAPTVMAPGGAQTTVTYTATPQDVCTVDGSTGVLTLLGVGSCVVTATATSSNNYNEATAMFTVTVLAQGPLALNLNTVAGDDTVNIAEKTAGFAITGNTDSEDGVSVSVTIGSTTLQTTSGSNGAWSVNVPPAASYITGTSVTVTVSASKTGFTPPSDVTRSLGVDLVEPSVSWTAPGSLQVGVAIGAMSPTTSDTDIASYSATGLPSGLTIGSATGVISGTPNSANASTQQAMVTVSDSADNTATTSITFPTVAKGDQTLTGFRYSAETVTFGSPAPTVMAPGGAQTTVTYTATPQDVCTVDGSTGVLTLLGVGGCVITATAASSNNYNEATATFTVTVLAQGPLALNLNTVAGEDTVNIAEKTAGFAITGNTGSEDGVSVSVTIGSQAPLTATSGSNGAWSVNVPPAASYITGTSVAVSVSASKTGFTPPSDVTRTLAVDLAAPSVSYTTPAGLQVEVAITAMSPTTSDTDIASYSATGLPSGLVIDAMTGAISGTPNSANASTQQATVTVSDSADNPATTLITFPMVAKGDQTLTGFRYSAETVTFGSPAPTVIAPTGAQTTLAYTATPSVCTVTSTGVLTLLGVGSCVVTATAASSNNYNEATATFTVTVLEQGALALNLHTVAGDDTVNIAEKTAGFTISGDTGTEDGVSVSVTIGSQAPLTATTDSQGEWSVMVSANAAYITGTSVAVTVSASKTGFTDPNDVTRTLAVDLAAPSVSYTTPTGLQVGVAISAMSPSGGSGINGYSAAGLPSGLGINTATGVISGMPNSANASTQQATVTVSDSADNPATTLITFPMVAKGDQTLTGFRYSAETVTFGSPAPTVMAPTGAQTTLAYTATPSVCTVTSTGALTLLGVGACVITATAASNNNYNEATATFTVTVLEQGALALNLHTVAGDDTVNIAEKTAGFAITGNTGSEDGVSVSVTIGSQAPLTATTDSQGEWSVMVSANAAYITGTSVAVSVSASKTGFTPPSDVTRTLAVDLAAPSVSYTAPSSLQVGVAISAMSPTTSDTDIASYSATGLPSGLVIDAMTGAISGTPNSANASTQQATVTVTDSAGNPADVSIAFPMVAKGDQAENPDTGSPQTENPDTEETEDEAHPDEREALLALYRATGGENWEYSDNWNTSAPVDTWHGVTVDPEEGRVIELDLAANGLSGEVPPSLLVNLPSLRRLYLNDNTLSAVPLAQLRDLLEGPNSALEELALWGNDLLGGTGDIFVELDRRVERAALRALYERTGGPRWKDSDSWLDETDLFSFSQWYEVITDDDGRVMELDLSDNGLSGEPGRELEALSALYSLNLSGNPDLSGELPRGLMELSALEVVNIEDTGMCAPGDTEFNQWLEGISFDGESCAEDGDDSPDTGVDTGEPDAGGGGGGCAVASGGSGVPFNLLLLIVALVLKLAAPARLPQLGAVGLR